MMAELVGLYPFIRRGCFKEDQVLLNKHMMKTDKIGYINIFPLIYT